MTVTLEIPPDLEQRLLAEARLRGIPFDQLLLEYLSSGTQPRAERGKSIFEQGLGLLGSAEDSAMVDEVVALAYEERRRPSGR